MNLDHYFQLKNHIHQIYQLKLLIVQFLYLLHSIIFQQNFHKFLQLFLLYNFFHKVNILNKINLLILEIFLNILLLFFHRELLYNMLYLCIYNIFLNLEKAIYFNSFFLFNVIYFDILHLMELLLLLYIEMVMFVFFQ